MTTPVHPPVPTRRLRRARRDPVRRASYAACSVGALCATLIVAASPVAAVGDVGASVRPGRPSSAVAYVPPVDGQVVDPFRAPVGPYAPGNRGLEYSTDPGSRVGAIGAGSVAFAGQVGGRLVVSIDHPDGLRSSVLGLVAITVRVGDQVAAGQTVGLAGPRLHLGVRRAGVYLDPGSLFPRSGPARLVPLWRAPPTATGFWPQVDRH